MKKIVIMLLAVAMVLSVFAGCSSQPSVENAQKLLDGGKTAEAITMLNTYIQSKPEDSAAYTLLATAYVANSDAAGALAALEVGFSQASDPTALVTKWVEVQKSAGYFEEVGDWYYYSNTAEGGALYMMKKDGTDKTAVVTYDATVGYDYGNAQNQGLVVVYDGYIYAGGYKANGITVQKADGSDSKTLDAGATRYLNVSDGWLYFCLNR